MLYLQRVCSGTSDQARSQHFYKGGHDDGGTKGPERGPEERAPERRKGEVWGGAP